MTATASTLRPLSTLEHFEHGINRVVVSSDEQLIATSDVDMNVTVRWNDDVVYSANFGSILEKVKPTERIRGLAFSPGADFLYVAAGDQITAVSTDTWQVAWSYEAPRSFGFLIISPIALDVAENGDVAAAFDNGSIVVWNSRGHKKVVIHDNDSPRWLRFVGDGERVIGSDSFSLCSWDVEKRKRRLKIAMNNRVFGFAVDKSESIAATRTLQDIVLWNLTKKEMIRAIPVEPGIPVLAFNPKKELIAYGERNRIHFVNYEGVLVGQFDLAVASALSLTFTPSGKELLIGCTEGKLIRREVAGA